MFEWKSCIKTTVATKSLAEKPNSTNKSFVPNPKCLNESVDKKQSTKGLLWKQTLPTKALFQIQIFWIKVLLWHPIFQEKSCFKTKLCQEIPCFEFKMFEWKSWIKIKFPKKNLTAKPNRANKSLVLNSKCFQDWKSCIETKFEKKKTLGPVMYYLFLYTKGS